MTPLNGMDKVVRQATAAVLAAGLCLAGTAAEPLPDAVVLRVRAVSVKPALYVRLFYPTANGGWDEVTKERPAPPSAAQAVPASGLMDKPAPEAGDVLALLADEPAEPDRILEEGKTDNFLWLKPGVWSPPAPLSSFAGFVTFRVGGLNPKTRKPEPVQAATLEFELSSRGKVLKTFSESSGEGDRLTVRLASPASPVPGPPEDSGGLLEYARNRADRLEALPWAKGPLPHRYIFMSACAGWKTQTGNPEVYLAEYRSLRQLGVNGIFYNTWPGLADLVKSKTGPGRAFARAMGENQNQALTRFPDQYLIPKFDPNNPRPGDGCPFDPVRADFAKNVRGGVAEMMTRLRAEPYDECWFQTISEIGSYFDNSPEGKAHQGVCPYCRQAFRDYLKGFGLTPADFGAVGWDDIRSTYGYWAKPWAEQQKDKGAVKAAADAEIKRTAAKNDPLVIDKEDEAKIAGLEEEPAGGEKPAAGAVETRKAPLSEAGWALLRYYSARFNNEASARIFAPLRAALEEQNALKREALAAGRADSPEARQPWVYSFALRGNSFLMGGHSLDFFDWYRHADNAFMYETSNRDPRTWPWDSYLCDVGRIHQEKLGTRFSLMIKPSRGAVIQRTLSAVARQVRAIYWYTYGPDWHHPDTFARVPERLDRVSRVVHMIGEAEDALYDAVPARPAEIAVVRPQTSAVFDNNASWENGKWVFEAFTHAHLPVDALDEGYLMSEDLSRYKVIAVSGSHIRRDVAEKLAHWVEAGGVLYTSAGGLARDEADRPLEALRPVLGLKSRAPVELWAEVKRYGAGELAALIPLRAVPAGAVVRPLGTFIKNNFPLAVGREALEPGAGVEVLATDGDGRPALVRHPYGKGSAVTAGFYAGLEYAADVLRPGYDMSVDFQAAKRDSVAAVAIAAGVRPVVDASHPLIEGALLRHPQSGRETLILINWAYKGDAVVPMERVTVAWRGAAATRVKSAWLRQSFPVETKDGWNRIVLPRVEEGDILMAE